MRNVAKFLIAALWTLAAISAGNAAAAFSDDDAKAFFEQQWNADVLTVPLGEFMLPPATPATAASGGPRPLTASELQMVTALKKIGVLAVTRHQDARGRVTLVIAATPAGTAANTSTAKDRLDIPIGQFTIDRVVKNDAYSDLIDEYRVVMVNMTVVWNKAYLQYVATFGGAPLQSARKAVLLVKLDPFADKWQYVIGDFANAADPFATSLVMSTIRQFH